MAREPGPAKKSWRDVDRARSSSFHAAETLGRHEQRPQSSASNEYKAALEALFQKKPDGAELLEKVAPAVRVAKVVGAEPSAPADATTNRRQDQLRKILAAQGQRQISDTVEAFLNAGHSLPDDQEVFLQMLEHRDEERVRDAIDKLDRLLMGQLPKRKPVLVQRLKRIEENAEESTTRDAAAVLRRKVA